MDDIIGYLIGKVLMIPAIIFAFSLKGFAQAWVAKKLGDPTPENAGKLTLNPLAHIDIVGFIFILIAGIGWGKPVPTNSRYYKHIKRDKTIQILSGPVGLIIGAFIMALPVLIFSYLDSVYENNILFYLTNVFYLVTSLCTTLAVFYMLPLPGLDGFELIVNFLPPRFNETIYKIERFSFIIFIVFILLLDYTPLGNIIFLPADLLSALFFNIWSLPVHLIFGAIRL